MPSAGAPPMNPQVELNLALILFVPWFAILAVLFWLYPQQPRSLQRTVFDSVSLVSATVLAAWGMHWSMENADPRFGHMWQQVLATLEDRANAAFAFWGEAAEVRDADGLKNLLPKGAQVARETVERSVATGQEVIGRTAKANEQIGEIAKSQFESAARNTQVNVEQATRAATEKAESFARGATKASKAK